MKPNVSILAIAFLVGSWLLPISAAAQSWSKQHSEPDKAYDGRWWLSLDSDEQSGFLNGSADCLTWVAHAKWLSHSVEQLEKKVTEYYETHPESGAMPVIEVWRRLLREIPPSKPLKGGEVWTNPHGYYDGLYWRQDSESGNRGFLEGYLLCMRTQVKSPSETYSRPVDYYGAKINAYLKANPKVDDEPIAVILSRFRDCPKQK